VTGGGGFMLSGGTAQRLAATVAAAVVCGIVLMSAVNAQRPDTVSELLAEANRLWHQGRYAEGIQVAERAVALARERRVEEEAEVASDSSGKSHPDTPASKTVSKSPLESLRQWATEYLNQRN
jgi:hypothetical protein